MARTTTLFCALALILCVVIFAQAKVKTSDSDDPRFTAPTTHYDLPVSVPPSEMTLETVQLYSRHGNRAADPIVESLCPKRKALTALYHEQQSSYGALTHNGIRALWELGTFTNEQYVKTGFIDGVYTRLTSQIRAAASDRTLISASAFGQTAYNTKYANSEFSIPVAVLTNDPEEDDLLEVRKARCAERLAEDIRYFDQNIAKKLIDDHKELIDMISNACGFDIMHGPELTNGEFSVMQLVKDLSDALTGDLLEGFPLMDGVTPESRAEFLQFAEDIFKRRHYRTIEMDSYLSGNAPNRIIKLFDRRVSFNTNTTVLDTMATSNHPNVVTYRDVVTQDAKRLPIIGPRPPRRLFAYHAHREVLYGLKNFLKLDLGVERDGIPTGLIHPGTGFFFELWANNTQIDQLLQQADKKQILPALNPNRKNSQRYLSNFVDDAYYLRVVLWVPCFDGMKAHSSLNPKEKIHFKRIDPETKKEICLARVRTLPQCDNKEFCPLSRVKQIMAENFNEANGDFRAHCPVHTELDPNFSEAAGFFLGSGKRSRQFKSGVVETKLSSIYTLDEIDHTPTTHQEHLLDQLKEEVEYALESDSDSFDEYDQRVDGPKSKAAKRAEKRKKKSIKTRGAALWPIGRESTEDVYNNQYKSTWASNLASFGGLIPKNKEVVPITNMKQYRRDHATDDDTE